MAQHHHTLRWEQASQYSLLFGESYPKLENQQPICRCDIDNPVLVDSACRSSFTANCLQICTSKQDDASAETEEYILALVDTGWHRLQLRDAPWFGGAPLSIILIRASLFPAIWKRTFETIHNTNMGVTHTSGKVNILCNVGEEKWSELTMSYKSSWTLTGPYTYWQAMPKTAGNDASVAPSAQTGNNTKRILAHLDSQAIASMLTSTIFPLVGKPIIRSRINSFTFVAGEQLVYVWNSHRATFNWPTG